MGTSKTRQEKIDFMKATITEFFKRKVAGRIDQDKLISEFMIKHNSTYRTGEELVNMLEDSGFIIVSDQGEITLR